ncbi:MAG: Ig-like domain-containing protein, partial [Gemmatimonadetes bacterium]|nr:Ig-like domain-containing protein [Gemmatimonadota bacterium]
RSTFDATKSAAASIRVDASAIVQSVTLNSSTVNLQVGNQSQLTATVTVGNNASKAVTWSTSNAAIATVDQTGRVTAVAAGAATISATAQADVTKVATANVTVTAPAFPSTATVQAGADSQFNPNSVDIAVGGSVSWVFGSLAHNVTFQSATGVPSSIGNSSNQTVSRTFGTAGSFQYTCTLHAGMDATVVVH